MTCGCLAATSEGGHFLEHQSGPEGLRKAEGEDIMILTSELEERRQECSKRQKDEEPDWRGQNIDSDAILNHIITTQSQLDLAKKGTESTREAPTD